MRFLLPTILLTLIISLSVSALPIINYRRPPFQKPFYLPHREPLPPCENQLLQLDRVDLLSNPSQPGQTLSIDASGTLLDNLEKGARVALDLTLDRTTFWDKTIDLYDKIRNDMTYLTNGRMELNTPVPLPRQIRSGNFHLEAKVYTKDSGQPTCRIEKGVYCV